MCFIKEMLTYAEKGMGTVGSVQARQVDDDRDGHKEKNGIFSEIFPKKNNMN